MKLRFICASPAKLARGTAKRPALEHVTANRGVTEHLRRAGQLCAAGDLRVTGPGYFESFKISRAAF